MKKSYLLIILLLNMIGSVTAQKNCGFDEVHKKLMQTDFNYAKNIEKTNKYLADYVLKHSVNNQAKSPNQIYTIPVVVHVLHTGEAVGTQNNPSDATIVNAIDYLNKVYDGTWPGMIQPVGGGGVVNMEIKFELAKRKPGCGGVTNGIDRVNMNSNQPYSLKGVNFPGASAATQGINDVTMKDMTRWDPTNYYNIWLVTSISISDFNQFSTVLGYAYMPTQTNSVIDGIVMLSREIGAGLSTLPHEMGHALDLYHVFEGSNGSTSCPINTNCLSNGDFVCDTDPIKYTGSGCNTGTNSCTATSYNVNTEQNFMNYGSCMTLFTNGQKARARAAMTLPPRASFATSLGATPMPAVINFASSDLNVNEDINSGGSVIGCRKYKEYVGWMNIDAPPAISNAVVQLNFSGTAVKGADYDLSTTTNFSSPSNQIVFSVGSTAPQPFYLRVFDDAEVENTIEFFDIGFTVANNGSTAIKGSCIQSQRVNITQTDKEPDAGVISLFSVGLPTTTTNVAPFYANGWAPGSLKSQYLYTAAELKTAGFKKGRIDSLSFHVQQKKSTVTFNDFTIKLAHLSQNVLSDLGGYYASANTLFTTVYTTNFNSPYQSVISWNKFKCSTPFFWDGVNSLLIEICHSSAYGSPFVPTSSDVISCYSSGAANEGDMAYNNLLNCSGAMSSPTVVPGRVKPILQLSALNDPVTVESNIGASKDEYIFTGSSDYFYSNNGGLLAQLTNVQSNLGCVSVRLDASGNTWANFGSGQRSSKIFDITPELNGSSAKYKVNLFYSLAELGGKPPTSLRLAKSTASSISNINLSNSTYVIPTISLIGTNIYRYSADFTGFSKFFLIDGFTTLSSNILNFTAELVDKKGLLKWETENEIEVNKYVVETSTNGNNYSEIGSMVAKNQPSKNSYSFTHSGLKANTYNYYRLKRVDNNQNIDYSKVVVLKLSDNNSTTSIYPNPAKNNLHITFNKQKSNISVQLANSIGQVMKQQTYRYASKILLPIIELGSGVYTLQINADGDWSTFKVVKSN
jgi:hypothetical protein